MNWGKWTFDAKYLTLTYSANDYEIDLEEIHSSAAILEWIFHIQNKAWADATTMYDLLRAFDDILKPQANYCSFGKGIHADGDRLAKEFAHSLRTTSRR